jgi:hypothetical protein
MTTRIAAVTAITAITKMIASARTTAAITTS